jgi:hypothetical protein
LQVPRVSNRDPEVNRRQSYTHDMRNSQRFTGKATERDILATTASLTSRASFNRTAMPKPETKADLRAETNGTIFEYNRQKRVEVVRMVQAEAAAADEHKVSVGYNRKICLVLPVVSCRPSTHTHTRTRTRTQHTHTHTHTHLAGIVALARKAAEGGRGA